MMEKIAQLMKNEEFQAKLETVKTPEDALAIFAEYGIKLTLAEVTEMMAGTVGADGELDMDALDNVAGGGWFSNWVKKLFKKNCNDLEKLSRF